MQYWSVKLEPNVHCFDNLLETTRFTVPRRQQKINGGVDTEHLVLAGFKSHKTNFVDPCLEVPNYSESKVTHD